MNAEGQPVPPEVGTRAPRVETEFLVRVRCALGTFPGRITNLSSTGFGLYSARELEPGMEVALETAKNEPIIGVIRWACGKESGGEFTERAAI